jgi:hypothetical protein
MNYGVINKEVIEFEFPDKASALELKPEIMDIASKNIPEIVDEVSLKYFGENDLFRINNLEIDLGEIDENNLKSEIIEKFYSCFEEEIKKIKRSQIYSADASASINSAQMDFELLTYFLSKGVLPWWAVEKDEIDFGKVVKHVTNELPGEFYNYLSSISSSENIIKRIISQFSNEAIEEIILLIKKKNSLAESSIKYFESILSGRKRDAISRELLNESILEILLRHIINAKINTSLQLLSVELIASIARKEKLKKTLVIEFIEDLFLKEESTVVSGSSTILDIKEYLNEIISNYKNDEETNAVSLLSQAKELLLGKVINVAKKRIENQESVGEESKLSGKERNLLWPDEKQEIIFGKKERKKKRDVLADGIEDENMAVNKGETANWEKSKEYFSEKKKSPLEEIIDEKQNIIIQDREKVNKHNKTEEIKKELKEIINVKYGEEKGKDIHPEKSIPFGKKTETNRKIKRKNPEFASEKDRILKEKGCARKGKRLSKVSTKREEGLKIISDNILISEESADKKISIEESIKVEEVMITPGKNTPDIKKEVVKSIQEETAQILKPFAKEEEEKLLEERSIQNVPEKIYIKNSGLVLASAFIPTLFGRLDILDENKTMNIESAIRGVHILQYLVTGNAEAPEYELSLNKILCGIDLLYPIEYKYEISDTEKNEVNDLMESMIKNWNALGNTSIAGLRESFLLRKGIITKDDEKFVLQVEQKAFDILLDRIPWSYSIIKYSWMNKPVYVEWP